MSLTMLLDAEQQPVAGRDFTDPVAGVPHRLA